MNPALATTSIKFKVGLFSLAGLLLIGLITVLVNDHPYWWRKCQPVSISVEDATGLKPKSPIRSLGLEIGYLSGVELSEMHVKLEICITAPVEILPITRAYIRGEGFLGDKFVELKPVKYLNAKPGNEPSPINSSVTREPQSVPAGESPVEESPFKKWTDGVSEFLLPSAMAQEGAPTPSTAPSASPSPVARTVRNTRGGGKEIPVGEQTQDVQQLVNRVDSLVVQMTGLTNNLKDAINPDDLRKTMKELNHTLENASRTLSPEGGLTQTAQRTLAKLEDSIEQLRDLMTRVNRGEGSVGMLINDPTYAQEIRDAIHNINALLSRVGGAQFWVDVGAEQITAYDSARGWFRLAIWPEPTRYYLVGITLSDPRGQRDEKITTTTSGGIQTVTQEVQINKSNPLFTVLLGKVFYRRVDAAVGALHGDGTASIAALLGPNGAEKTIQLRNDIYSRAGDGLNDRLTLQANPFETVYVKAGIESFRSVNGKTPLTFGAGLTFNDQDIKLLFALR